ncbi:ferredoxin [Methanolobus sp. WCC5]|uniref:ferredoxin n=1 Tax=Methanolobus sp. WCC5 TaxID=3125785 RepID=UPI003255FAB0
MADQTNKASENIPGRYYVDDNCIMCKVCLTIAPEIFAISDDGTHAYVQKQPENEDETAACEDALLSCPVEAIGSNGE